MSLLGHHRSAAVAAMLGIAAVVVYARAPDAAAAAVAEVEANVDDQPSAAGENPAPPTPPTPPTPPAPPAPSSADQDEQNDEAAEPGFVSGVLPGEDTYDNAPARPAAILDEYAMTADRFAQLTDGEAVMDVPDDRDLLLRLMLRLPGIPLLNMEHWAKPKQDLSGLVQSPGKFRGQPFHVKGRVVKVDALKLAEPQATLFEFDRFYRCHLLAGEPEIPAVVYAREIPKTWKLGTEIDEHVSFNGLFLKRGAGSVGLAPVVFVAQRVAWHPNTNLGNLGMDIGLLDSVRHNRGLLETENECFYQMLAAVSNAGSAELLRHARRYLVEEGRKYVKRRNELRKTEEELSAAFEGLSPGQAKDRAAQLAKVKSELRMTETRIKHVQEHGSNEFLPLLQDPAAQMGKLCMYRGTALRVTRIRVTDNSLVQRFGIKEYFQLDVMVNLEHKTKIVRPGKDGKPDPNQVERITWTHPAVLCALKLPEGMPDSGYIHEDIRFVGFFLKNWAYPTDEVKDDQTQWKSAPMFIGREPFIEAPPPSAFGKYAGAIAAGLFVVALAGVWIGVWQLGRGDKAFQQVVKQKIYTIEDGMSLNDLSLEVTTVDFSYLNEQASDGDGGQPQTATLVTEAIPPGDSPRAADAPST